MKYAHTDNLGKILGWYDKEIHTIIPSPNIEVTDAQWQIAIDNGHNKISADGATEVFDFSTDSEKLTNTKTAKLQELEIAFITASKLPVIVGTKTYNGGKESAQALRDYIQLVTESGGTSFTIWDSSNSISTYTLVEATAIKLAVATAVAQGEFNLRMKKNAVNDATTITAVSAVTY